MKLIDPAIHTEKFKSRFLELLATDSVFKNQIKDLLVPPTPTLVSVEPRKEFENHIIDEKGILIKSYRDFRMGVEGVFDCFCPIRVDSVGTTKMYATQLNVEELFIEGRRFTFS